MAANKNIADIPQEEVEKFLLGAKDASIESKPPIEETFTENVNVNMDTNNAISQIGREATFEKNFVRQTYYVHKDIIKQIDKLAKKGAKGTKTKIINAALQAYLDNLLDSM